MTVPAADYLRRERVPWRGAWEAMTDAADLLDEIDALHQPECVDYAAPLGCTTCDTYWPCPTARLLHPAPKEDK